MNHAAAILGVLAALPILLALAPGERPATPALHGADLCELAAADRARTPSRSCLTCHDGSVASGRMARSHEEAGAHPVDVDYVSSQARRPSGLRAAAALPAALPLVGGKVACTTCHDARSAERGKPALTMSRSAMCLACHDV